MTALTGAAAYLLAHLALYALVLRNLRPFSREPVIFLYHLASVAGTVLVLGALLLAGPDDGVSLAAAVGVVALHGIYSTSFLELWSLSEGGYSLAIMAHVEERRSRGLPVVLEGLRDIGRSKQSARLGGIERLGLVRRAGGRVSLTPAGSVVAAGLAVVAWAARIREQG
jgi:hypothetical protein